MIDLFKFNKQMINRYANHTYEKDIDSIKQYRKNICRLSNENINTYENQESNNKNTILFISISKIDKGKIIVINQLLKSKYKYVLGIDKKYYENETEFNKHLEDFSDFIVNNLETDIKIFYNITKIWLNDNFYKKKYGEKITNYNGRWENNPSKFGSLEWFYYSKYEYFWFIEDDVFCKDFDIFLSNYNNYLDDLICTINFNHLPKWYYTGWRVGDIMHGFEHAHLYVTRYSKQFATNFFKFINETETTSHHELLIPYILNYYHMKHSNLIKTHTKTLHINNGSTKCFDLSDNNINNYNTEIFHPFKIN